MTRHKHAELIIAKAENMGLVVFVKTCTDGAWILAKEPVQWWEDNEYFASLPQHKEACLHWLNGGEVQQSPLDIEQWVSCGSNKKWMSFCSFMSEKVRFRIKPRKEKLYIAVKTDKYEHLGGCRKVRICSHAFLSKEDAEGYLDLSDSQLFEIEVEV